MMYRETIRSDNRAAPRLAATAMSQVAVGDAVELCWSAGDGGYYDAIVTAASAAELTFEYAANAEWAAFTEVVDVADLPRRCAHGARLRT